MELERYFLLFWDDTISDWYLQGIHDEEPSLTLTNQAIAYKLIKGQIIKERKYDQNTN